MICSSESEISVLITVRRVHYSKMGKVPTTHSTLLAESLDGLQCLHRDECKSAGTVNTGVPLCGSHQENLWVCFCLSSGSQFALFVLLECFVRWVVSGRTDAVLRGASSSVCLKQLTAFSCSSKSVFSPSTSLKSKVVKLYNSTDRTRTSKNSRFIQFERSDFHVVDNLLIAVHPFPMHMLTSRRNYDRCRWRRWFSFPCKYTCPSRISVG